LAINPCPKVITALANFFGFNQLKFKLPPSFLSFQALGKTLKIVILIWLFITFSDKSTEADFDIWLPDVSSWCSLCRPQVNWSVARFSSVLRNIPLFCVYQFRPLVVQRVTWV